MDKAIDAEELVQSAVNISIYLGHLSKEVSDLEESERTKRIRRYLGEAMGRIHVNIILPLCDVYPEFEIKNIDYDSFPD